MARDLLDKFKKANHTMSDKPENSLLADIEELRRSVRQYKQAIWFGGGGEKVAVEALQLELAAYETITREVDTFHDHIALQARENLRIRSDMFDDTWNTWIDVLRSVETFPLLPQLLLISAEISQELLQFLSDFILVKSNVDMLEEWTEVAYRILKCAEQLSVLVSYVFAFMNSLFMFPFTQLEETDVIFYGEVMNMKASILREMGNMLVDTNGNVAEAVDFFRRSYAVYEELRRYMHSKQHGQLARYDVDAASATYAGLAKALCLNKQHDEGLLRYDIVLDDFARLHNSQFHPSLANLFLGRGLCARDAGQLDDAIRTLDMCLDICRRWPDISFGEIPHHALAVMRHAEAELRTGEL
ncbi:unnamed protein product [Symbiodinium microadriaticum]|nr:unnamed protein product [Symbiodinium microadriaticum]